MNKLAACISACVLLSSSPVLAQGVDKDGYRMGLPGVMTPPPPPRKPKPPTPPPPPRLSPWEDAYGRAGKPRMVLFFNRDVSDDTRGNPVLRLHEETNASVHVEGHDGDATQSVRGQADVTREVSVERRATGARAAAGDEAGRWQFEAAFTQRLEAEHARLVDRSAAIRIVGMSHVTDPQVLETAAMQGLAEVVILVRSAPMSDGKSLWRMTAISTRSGHVEADVVLAGGDMGMEDAGRAAGEKLVQALISNWKGAAH